MPAVHREHAPAKLTRSLRVVGRRSDGFHLLEAEMVSLDFGDDLEIAEGDGLELVDAIAWSSPASDGRGGPGAVRGGQLAPGGFGVPEGPDNLVLRALHLARRRARVRLVKRVPPGAGLGGGSSDAAAVLRWAGATDPLAAARLGADVPFCLVGGRALVSGIGERVAPLPFEEGAFVVASPSFGVSSALAYQAFDEVGPGPGDDRTNDLEHAACTVEPRLGRWRAILEEVAGAPPALAGSGSSWFVPCCVEQGAALAEQVDRALEAAGERAVVTLCRSIDTWIP